jgi:hypothetical protein
MENKHISRINISDDCKIVINSPEVYFGITRQHAEVGQKNLIVFSYKNFVQFLAQELVITSHTTYPKNRYKGLMDFEISQI